MTMHDDGKGFIDFVDGPYTMQVFYPYYAPYIFDETVVFSGGKATISLSPPPSPLPSTATYQATIAKLEEILDYCDKNPGNTATRSAAAGMKTSLESSVATYTDTGPVWQAARSSYIGTINDNYIPGLQ
jgi:hypothetical protein